MRSIVILLTCLLMIQSHAQPQPIEDNNAIVYVCPPCGCINDGKHFDTMGICAECNMSRNSIFPGVEPLAPPRALTIGMLLFNGADIMDVTGPWSVFEHNGVNVVSFSKSLEPVTVGMNLEVTPDFTLKTLPQVDVLVFPGGGLAETNPADKEIQDFIKERAQSTEVLFSVCSGAFFLGEAGLLDGNEATTFASLIPALASNYPKAKVLDNVKYVDNGKVVTSAGLSSGIDASFYVISKFRGEGNVQDVANHMEYSWTKKHDYARSQLADNFVLGVKGLASTFSTKYLYSRGDVNQWEYRLLLSQQVTPQRALEVFRSELSKDANWHIQSVKDNTLTGIVNHNRLGKGKVVLTIESKPEGNVISISANRMKKYELIQNVDVQ